MKKSVIVFILFLSFSLYAQEDKTFLQTIEGLSNGTVLFYDIDGLQISTQTVNYELKEKNLRKIERKYGIKKGTPRTTEQSISTRNYVYTISEVLGEGLTQTRKIYFFDINGRTSIVSFDALNQLDDSLTEEFVAHFLADDLPEDIYASLTSLTTDFAGRDLTFGSICRWMNVRNIQCPYNGQMNWSLHKNMESAKRAIENQFLSTKYKKGSKVLSEEQIDIVFEGKDTKAQKVVLDITGVNSLLVGMSGGKTLTIYYVFEEIRGHYISCVLSHWNNDNINSSGLPALLEEVMRLK